MALHAFSREVIDGLQPLDLYAADYQDFVVESVETLDAAGLLGRDRVRIAFEQLHEQEDGAELLAGELGALLREASGVEYLDVERRVRAISPVASVARPCADPVEA